MPNRVDLDDSFLSSSRPASAFLWPEVRPGQADDYVFTNDDIFVFQYWPETVEATYTTNYSEKITPGGSHPLFQWTGGSGREISFTAVFTSESDPRSLLEDVGTAPYPSVRYTVDVAAAAARLESYLRPYYNSGTLDSATEPPQRLYLVLPNLNLGGNRDEILVILRSAPISYQASFPSGIPKIIEVSCTFAEVVQHMATGEGSQVTFIGRNDFETKAKDYKYRGSVYSVPPSPSA